MTTHTKWREQMEIHIQDPFQLSNAGIVAGHIWFSDEEWCFPCAEYSDYPFSCILSWIDILCDCLNDNKSKDTNHYNLLFFDGPYMLKLERTILSPILHLTFYDGFSIERDSIVGETAVLTKK